MLEVPIQYHPPRKNALRPAHQSNYEVYLLAENSYIHNQLAMRP
jgi:hypothetical protein